MEEEALGHVSADSRFSRSLAPTSLFLVIHTLSMLFITYYHLQLAAAQLLLPALAIATLVHGMGGGRHVIVMSIFALVADVTTRQERTTYIARFESILLGSFTLGPLVGGELEFSQFCGQ